MITNADRVIITQLLSSNGCSSNLLCQRPNHVTTHTTIVEGSHAPSHTHRTMFGTTLKRNAASQLMSVVGGEFPCQYRSTTDHSTATCVDRTPGPGANASATTTLLPSASGSGANERIAAPVPVWQSQLQEPRVQDLAPGRRSSPHSAISIAGAEKGPSARRAAGAGESKTGSVHHGQGRKDGRRQQPRA